MQTKSKTRATRKTSFQWAVVGVTANTVHHSGLAAAREGSGCSDAPLSPNKAPQKSPKLARR